MISNTYANSGLAERKTDRSRTLSRIDGRERGGVTGGTGDGHGAAEGQGEGYQRRCLSGRGLLPEGMHAYILGTASTAFRRHPDRDFRDLADEAVGGALEDAGFAPDAEAPVDAVHFGNCAMHAWGQANIRGQVALANLVRDGRLPARAPVTNVEGGCATGSLALLGAVRDVLAGQAQVALAVGVEKVLLPDDPVGTFQLFAGGIDQRDPKRWQTFFAAEAERLGLDWAPHPQRIIFLDVHALQAAWHMKTFGTTAEQIAAVAAKNHDHGALNPKAQYQVAMNVEQVLADKPVVGALTRSMCSPISDGAAAVVVCSEAFLRAQPPEVQARALRVRAATLVGGAYHPMEAQTVAHHAAQKAYAAAGLGPADVDVAELHDATAFCEILHTEALGFCPPGQGGPYAASGATRQTGARPINLSGGLASKGHPLAATGLGMIDELALQLRGAAGPRQAPHAPRVALALNAGGLIGFDEALAAVTLLDRPA